jgi:hypothetical protein
MTDISTIDAPQPKPADVSPRIHELMQRLDRLPPGIYEIRLEKGEVRAQDWQVEIVRTERIQNFRLSKYKPE